MLNPFGVDLQALSQGRVECGSQLDQSMRFVIRVPDLRCRHLLEGGIDCPEYVAAAARPIAMVTTAPKDQ